jgi:hypothetical protein
VFSVSAVHVELPNIVDRDLGLLELDLVCVGGELGRERAHMVRKSGAEEQNLRCCRTLRKLAGLFVGTLPSVPTKR